MYCNRCYAPQPASSQCLATCCMHLFCIKCAKEEFDAGTVCPVCGTSLSKSRIKIVKILSEDEELNLSLAGQTPEIASRASEAAVSFYLEQVQVFAQVKERSHKDKMAKLQQAAKRKIDEFYKVG